MSKRRYLGNSPRLTNGKHYEVLGTDNNPYRDGADYVFVKDDNGCGRWVKSSEFGEKAQ